MITTENTDFPLGVSHYRKLVTGNYHFVDKTLQIKNIIEEGAPLTIFTRPRRFGKTLFMSMLAHFFSHSQERLPTKELFKNCQLQEQYPHLVKEHQGTYQVIFLSLKDIKARLFTDAMADFDVVLSELFAQFPLLLDEKSLTRAEKDTVKRFFEKKINAKDRKYALRYLSQYLNKVTGDKILVLIDEYDTPIQAAFLNSYYEDLIEFMRSFLGAALKDNTAVHKAIITGITRIAKESLFSDLNNPFICTVLDNEYSEAFGFTEPEINKLLQKVNLQHQSSEIKTWYNGYQIGHSTIYNPWSIINCLKKKGQLQAYWVNTSTNDLMKRLLATSTQTVKTQLEDLIACQTITTTIDIFTHFSELDKQDTALWHLLLSCGYVTTVKTRYQGIKPLCDIKIPNQEILYLFTDIISSWFRESIDTFQYQNLLDNLVQGHVSEFKEALQEYLRQSGSYFDPSGRSPEKFYHGLILGLLYSLKSTHTILSNRESGFGRYDVALIPKPNSTHCLTVLMEFKRAIGRNPDLEATASQALSQINQKQYVTELPHQGKILKIGLAFFGKKVAVASDAS